MEKLLTPSNKSWQFMKSASVIQKNITPLAANC